MTGTQIKPLAAKLSEKALAAERERSPRLAAAYDEAVAANGTLAEANGALTEANGALVEAAQALLTALGADEATVAGCATEIAALAALMPEEEASSGGEGE